MTDRPTDSISERVHALIFNGITRASSSATDERDDPRCCRFPKSCSATAYDPEQVTDEYLEDQP